MIEEFRANHGQLGGPFAGGTMLLLHHKGAKSGTERVNPLAYQPPRRRLRDLRVEGGRSDEPRLVLQPQGQSRHDRRDRRRHDLRARPGRRGRRARQDLDQAGRARCPASASTRRSPAARSPSSSSSPAERLPPMLRDSRVARLPHYAAPDRALGQRSAALSDSHCARSWENTSSAPPASCSRSHVNVSRWRSPS